MIGTLRFQYMLQAAWSILHCTFLHTWSLWCRPASSQLFKAQAYRGIQRGLGQRWRLGEPQLSLPHHVRAIVLIFYEMVTTTTSMVPFRQREDHFSRWWRRSCLLYCHLQEYKQKKRRERLTTYCMRTSSSEWGRRQRSTCTRLLANCALSSFASRWRGGGTIVVIIGRGDLLVAGRGAIAVLVSVAVVRRWGWD